jgi:hypothetical protein
MTFRISIGSRQVIVLTDATIVRACKLAFTTQSTKLAFTSAWHDDKTRKPSVLATSHCVFYLSLPCTTLSLRSLTTFPCINFRRKHSQKVSATDNCTIVSRRKQHYPRDTLHFLSDQFVSNINIMPQKRKQPEFDIFNSSTPSPQKRNRPSPASLKRKASEDTNASFSPSSAKKVRYTAQPRPTATLNPSRTRQTTLKHEPSSSQSRLVPHGPRASAKPGHKDETLLRMLCSDNSSGELKELHFRNMPHSAIDWTSASHINKINNWRNQIYGRAGMKSKAVTVWLPIEESWFELYFHLSIAESRRRGFILPKTTHVLTAFNDTFVGQVVRGLKGEDTQPRVERKPNAFAAKFNRMCPELRARLWQCTFGKSGDVYVPEITLEMVYEYEKMKEEFGIEKESVYAGQLKEWCRLFANLPSIGDGGRKDESVPQVEDRVGDGRGTSDDVSLAEDEAAAVLVSMATASYSVTRCTTPVGEVDIESLIASPD